MIAKKDAECSLAHLSHSFRRQPVAKRSQSVVVEAFAQPLVKMNSEKLIQLLELPPG